MSSSQYNLTWDSYPEKIRQGFTNLQQNEEFVDMTLAAQGYLVKVHKNIVSLVSPFIKAMIKSTSHDHPIIFLSNISHAVLCYIVEYIYTGEIKLPLQELQAFLNAAADLHILGLESSEQLLQNSSLQFDQNEQNQINETSCSNQQPVTSEGIITENNDICPIESNVENITMLNSYDVDPAPSENITILDSSLFNVDPVVNQMGNIQNIYPTTEYSSIPIINPIQNDTTEVTQNNTINVGTNIAVVNDWKPQQYSVSTRGSLQLILNRYIYHMQYQTSHSLKRRWRCIEYRRKRCKAYIDTRGEIIFERKNIHNHPYHDDKILSKVKRKQIYGTLASIKIDNNFMHNVDEDSN